MPLCTAEGRFKVKFKEIPHFIAYKIISFIIIFLLINLGDSSKKMYSDPQFIVMIN